MATARPSRSLWRQMNATFAVARLEAAPLTGAPVVDVDALSEEEERTYFDVLLAMQKFAKMVKQRASTPNDTLVQHTRP